MNDKESHEPGDADFERFMRETSHHVCSFPLAVLQEKMKAVLAMYSDTLEGYIKLSSMEVVDTEKNNTLFKNKLAKNLDKCTRTAQETFEQFNYLIFQDGEEYSDEQN
jgi:Ca2+-binding EF-hand superfamily protein